MTEKHGCQCCCDPATKRMPDGAWVCGECFEFVTGRDLKAEAEEDAAREMGCEDYFNMTGDLPGNK